MCTTLKETFPTGAQGYARFELGALLLAALVGFRLERAVGARELLQLLNQLLLLVLRRSQLRVCLSAL